MSDAIPEHRAAISPRSGDTHVIGDDGQAVNVDQAARDAAAAAEAKAAKRPAPKGDGASTESNPAA
jgi:hypothetical protein